MVDRTARCALIAAVLTAGCGAVDSPPVATPVPSDAAMLTTPTDERAILRQTIAFTFEDVLYTALGDGSKRMVVTDFPGGPYPYAGPHWSPDGDRLLIRMEDETSAGVAGLIYRVDGDGADLTDLSAVSGSTSDAMADWSPDGTRIVFTSQRAGDRFAQLYLMDADGSNPRALVETAFEVQYPAWSNSGLIAFAGVVDGGFDLYTVRDDGSGLARLTDDPSPDNWPTWAPDGSRLAFHSAREGVDGIWVMDADGSDERFLVEGGEPSWSPHGDEIVFDCGGAETARICAIRPDGSGATLLFDDAGFPDVRP